MELSLALHVQDDCSVSTHTLHTLTHTIYHTFSSALVAVWLGQTSVVAVSFRVWSHIFVMSCPLQNPQDSAGESLYMLFRAIKHQVDKGPVDAVTSKAKYTLNDNRLLREDLEYKTLVIEWFLRFECSSCRGTFR